MQNRELSWLKFNERVLEESNYAENPLLERLKYISIFSSNLDEFFMIRVGSLTDYMLYAPEYFDNKTGMSAAEQLDAVFLQTASLSAMKDRYYEAVMTELSEHGVLHINLEQMDPAGLERMEEYFANSILPLLSPQIIDGRHPFPHIDNKRLYIAVTLDRKSKPVFGLIAAPTSIERIIFPDEDFRFVLLEDLIYHFSHLIFKPYKVRDKTVLAVTRNADLSAEEGSAIYDEDLDYRQIMQQLVKQRKRLLPVRLELQYAVSSAFKSFFYEKLSINEKQVFVSSTPLDLSFSYKLEDKLKNGDNTRLIRSSHIPSDVYAAEKKTGLIRLVQKNDVFFSYPFDSITPFLEMLRQAAEDTSVMSIKITLYRIASRSKLAESLIRAAENGKEVIILLELRARFDEENNIEWAQRFFEAGCQVIYGPSEYKVHSKICLITKKDFSRIQYITQIGTGNYNEITAKQYTDISLITANQEIGKDAALFFNNLLLDNTSGEYTHLWVAPGHYKDNIIECIENERRKAESGESGQIIIKCNSLTDREIIVKLIEASRSGVKISMIIRGICCLTPGIPGLTENIKVVSIVGRFLEHSRIFCFGAGNATRVYISSADFMTRNTERRIEIACPILDPGIKDKIRAMLETLLMDNTKAWDQLPDGRYVLRTSHPDIRINSQEMFIDQSRIAAASSLDREPGTGNSTSLRKNIGALLSKIRKKRAV